MSETTTVCKCGHVEEAHEVDGCNHCYCGNFWAVRGGPLAPDAPTATGVTNAEVEVLRRWSPGLSLNDATLLLSDLARVRAVPPPPDTAAAPTEPTDEEVKAFLAANWEARNPGHLFPWWDETAMPGGKQFVGTKTALRNFLQLRADRAPATPEAHPTDAPTLNALWREAEGAAGIVADNVFDALAPTDATYLDQVADVLEREWFGTYARELRGIAHRLRAPAPATDDAPTEKESVERLAKLLAYVMGDPLTPTNKHRMFARDLLKRGVDVSRAGFLTVHLASPRATAPAPTTEAKGNPECNRCGWPLSEHTGGWPKGTPGTTCPLKPLRPRAPGAPTPTED
jgi:hypothetical protein